MKFPWANAKDDDFYISLLRYGKQNILSPLKSEDIHSHISSLDPELEIDHINLMISKMFDVKRKGGDYEYVLSLDSYFHLLEHDELYEARRSSRNATYFAAFAIIISIASIVASMVFIDTVKLDSQQISNFADLVNPQE
jgi:hypothetical protein